MKKRQNQREALKKDKSNVGILIVNVAAENCDRQNLDNLIIWDIVEPSNVITLNKLGYTKEMPAHHIKYL